MRVIIAGSRTIQSADLVAQAIAESGFEITEVVCGEARGVDTLGRKWAEAAGIPVASYPADWDRYGLSAGFRRNREMLKHADALIAVTTGSRGTAHMIDIAASSGIPVYATTVKGHSMRFNTTKRG